ncbi:CACTA en-spm transposon protein [Cucumis melo var. makuwa]|uniref:CACTA en-spm transposon protein n=1 Tax=Cucumis melo var. makuwa TaxID=1194695 RepID=A0A5D3E0H9_CUCMM|nr:CACTA en-spm transposon protein [Cucumis melo var. makuwa]TYK29201.1 CACTA en-spm transposon protein [Cucumis melo var. makuwa]
MIRVSDLDILQANIIIILSETTQPSSIPRRRVQSRLLELERYFHANGRILMSISPGMEKPIGVCVKKTLSDRCLRWANVGREYIEVVKGNLQHFFMLDFNDQAMKRFVEHQMLTSFKEFKSDCDRHFKKSSLGNEVSQSSVWSSSGKHTFESTRLYLRPHRMCIIKSWNSSPSLPEDSQLLSRDEICETILEKDIRDVSFTSGTNAKAHRRLESDIARTMIPRGPDGVG